MVARASQFRFGTSVALATLCASADVRNAIRETAQAQVRPGQPEETRA
jgi:hypothetical protein